MGVNWQQLFVPETSLMELVLRGSAMYLFLFTVLRILVRRHVGPLSLMDLLLLVLIADAAQNAMAGQYQTVTEGVVLCATLLFWNYFLDWLGYRFPALGRWLEPSPLSLVQAGRLQRRNMRMELLTEQELMSQLREQGIDDLAEVREAFMEPDGAISVLRYENDKQNQQRAQRPKNQAI